MDDLDFVAVMLADPEVMRYYSKCYTRDEAAAWVQRSMDRYARHGHGLWLVSDKATGQAVGQVGLVTQTVRGLEEREVGYLLNSAACGPMLAELETSPHPSSRE